MVQASRTKYFLNILILLPFLPACEEPLNLSAPYQQGAVRQIVAKSGHLSGGHFCYIDPTGELFCLGDNSRGQLGSGSEEEYSSTFVKVNIPQKGETSDKWFSVSAGYNHTCGLTTTGKLYCFGDNQYSQLGQLGRPFDKPAREPVQVPGQYIAVAAGGSYTCAITAGHELHCFGMAPGGGWTLVNGQSKLLLDSPRVISSQRNWQTISSSSSHLCAINDGGELWCLGENRFGRLGLNTTSETVLKKAHIKSRFVSVTAGERYTCGVTTKGQLYCQGDSRLYPDYHGQQTDWWQVEGGDWASVMFGNGGICGLSAVGIMSCFGDNRFSQLGIDTPFGTSTIGSFKGQFVAAVPFGHTNCGLKADGSWWCAGKSEEISQLLLMFKSDQNSISLKPQQSLGEGYAQVAAGQNHTCAVRWDQNVYCFGDNSLGQCGQPLSDKVIMQPQIVDGLSMTVELSCGANHCCARTEEGTVHCFGDNSVGQFSPSEVGQVIPVPHLLNKKFRTIAAGFEHTCGIDLDGNAVCYGSGKEFGASGTSYGPFKLTGGPWTKVIMGRNNICFNNKYQLACLGDNRYGQLFETGIWARRSPSVLKMAAVKDVAMAQDSIFVIKRDNTLGCWGSSKLCWPVVNAKENSVHLWSLDSGSQFKSIWANEALNDKQGQLCGIMNDDKVACLGNSYDGQFIKEPKALELTGNYKMAAVGGHHSCVLNGAGELFCLGDNSHYQLGLELPGRSELLQLWPVVSE